MVYVRGTGNELAAKQSSVGWGRWPLLDARLDPNREALAFPGLPRAFSRKRAFSRLFLPNSCNFKLDSISQPVSILDTSQH